MRDCILQIRVGENVKVNEDAIDDTGKNVQRCRADSVSCRSWQQDQDSLYDGTERQPSRYVNVDTE